MRELVVYLRAVTIFLAGIVVGTLVVRPSAAQENGNPGLRLNHVGIAVKDADFEQSVNFYTKVMGFRVAFRFPGPEGKPTTTYFQISRDTFLEMAPAGADQPAGIITHMGIETPDLKSTVMRLRAAGATVQDIRVSGPTKALLSNITAPNGTRMELIELTPDSLHKKAEESWK